MPALGGPSMDPGVRRRRVGAGRVRVPRRGKRGAARARGSAAACREGESSGVRARSARVPPAPSGSSPGGRASGRVGRERLLEPPWLAEHRFLARRFVASRFWQGRIRAVGTRGELRGGQSVGGTPRPALRPFCRAHTLLSSAAALAFALCASPLSQGVSPCCLLPSARVVSLSVSN